MDTSQQISQAKRELKIAIIVIVAVQFVIVGYLFNLEWESRKAGPAGDGFPINFEASVNGVMCYGCVLVCGTILCIVNRSWKLILLQWVIPLSVFAYALIPDFNPRLDAKDYQHLVGQTQADVETELRPVRRPITKLSVPDTEESYYEHYNGMTIRYKREAFDSGKWKVISVTPD